MKRARLWTLVLVVLGGALAWGQTWCDPCAPPPPPEPPCYITFWAGEPILAELVIPWGLFCCNPCQSATMITGWSVEAFGGGVVFQYAYPVPVSAGTKIVWDQKDLAGTQVAPGFYKIVVTTTDRAVSIHVKIENKRADCCFFVCTPFSRPCGISFCDPYLKVSRAPSCTSCGDPCCDPCCFPWLFPFLFMFGK